MEKSRNGIRKRGDTYQYRKRVKRLDGTTEDINGSGYLTRDAAEQAMIEHIKRIQHITYNPGREKIPTFEYWFTNNYWNEYVVTRNNKPGTKDLKREIFDNRLKDRFGGLRLDEINHQSILSFHADLIREGIGASYINNILTIINQCLKHAVITGHLDRSPQIQFMRILKEMVEPFKYFQYSSIVRSAANDETSWYVGVLLAGEAGLRVGEIKALEWDDIDFDSNSILIQRQVRDGIVGTPKGYTSRTVFITQKLREVLIAMESVRTSNHVVNEDGKMKSDNQAASSIYRIYKRAGLAINRADAGGWHRLRHSFATHAAYFGVNPWSLMSWLGHKDLSETMTYVNYSKKHQQEIPQIILKAGQDLHDDKRIIAMLGARWTYIGAHVVKTNQATVTAANVPEPPEKPPLLAVQHRLEIPQCTPSKRAPNKL